MKSTFRPFALVGVLTTLAGAFAVVLHGGLTGMSSRGGGAEIQNMLFAPALLGPLVWVAASVGCAFCKPRIAAIMLTLAAGVQVAATVQWWRTQTKSVAMLNNYMSGSAESAVAFAVIALYVICLGWTCWIGMTAPVRKPAVSGARKG
jgi:hypothetical protein